MFQRISGNVEEDSGECSRGFRGMFKKIPGNDQEDFGKSKFRFVWWNCAYFFYQILQLNCEKTGIFSALLIITYN